MTLNVGDTVRLTASEGAIPAGATGVVIRLFRHVDGDLVTVKFAKRTRVMYSASLENVNGNGRAAAHRRN